MKKNKVIIGIVVLGALAAAASSVWPPIGPAGVADTHSTALAVPPPEPVAVISVDVEALSEHMFTELEPLLGVRLDDAETRKELGTYFEGRVGFDPFAVRRMVVFAMDDDPTMLLYGDFEFDPTVGRQVEHEGHTLTKLGGGLWATPVAKALAIGEKKELRLLIDVERGEHEALAGTGPGDLHAETLGALGNGVLLATVVFNEEMNEELGRDLVEGASIQSAGLQVGVRDGVLLLRADQATREALLERLDTLKADARKGIDAAREGLERLDLLPAIGVVVADRHMDEIFEKLTPKTDGDYLRLRLDSEGASLLYLTALLSTATGIAVPMVFEPRLF